MVGHEHALNIQKTQDALTKKEWLIVYAGATNPPEDDGFGYMYNWIEFSCQQKDGDHFLIVDIFPRAWNQAEVRFDADRGRLGGTSEFARIEIACPNLQLRPDDGHDEAAVAEQATPVPVVQESELSSISAVEPTATRHGEAIMSSDNAGFDRLRYLFWRYLDWQQRLKILVAIDALPKTADQPIPQTLERLALETAASSAGKLHDLWEAIMPLIPAEKRATNPFPSSPR
jgi:hypothetical protein